MPTCNCKAVLPTVFHLVGVSVFCTDMPIGLLEHAWIGGCTLYLPLTSGFGFHIPIRQLLSTHRPATSACCICRIRDVVHGNGRLIRPLTLWTLLLVDARTSISHLSTVLDATHILSINNFNIRRLNGFFSLHLLFCPLLLTVFPRSAERNAW